MAFAQPNRWRQLQRHELSAQYHDIGGPDFDNFKLSLKTEGFDKGRPIILHEGKVLDGWQRQRACLEAGVKPIYAPLPKGITPERYVQRMNDWRRHESQEQKERRLAQRQKRVAEARADGESFRKIAEREQIGEATARRDAQAAGAPHGAPAGENGKVTGKDGKKYAATKPRQLLCERCKRVGPCKDCEKCAEIRKGKPVERDAHERRESGKVLFDFAKADSHFGCVVREADDIARAYKGEKDSQEFATVQELLRQLANVRKAWHARLKKVKD